MKTSTKKILQKYFLVVEKWIWCKSWLLCCKFSHNIGFHGIQNDAKGKVMFFQDTEMNGVSVNLEFISLFPIPK